MISEPTAELSFWCLPLRVLFSRIRDRLRHFLFAANPFYLLSALSMLTGCYLLGWILRPEASAGLLKPLILIGTLQVYEALLIGLGLYLAARPVTARDGRHLLLLEVLFLVDATYLGTESIVAGAHSGFLVAGLVLLVTAAKAAFIMYRLGIRVGLPTGLFLALQLSILYLLPALLAWLHRTAGLSQTGIYGAWWVIGLLFLLHGLLPRRTSAGASYSIRSLFLPALSLAAFLPLCLRVFVAGWDLELGPLQPFFLTPLVAVTALLALTRARPPVRGPHLALLLSLPALAIILSLNLPFSLECDFGTHWALRLVAPFRVTLLVAGLLYLYAARRLKVRLALLLAWPALFLAASGYSLHDADANLQQLADYLLYLGDRLIPHTPGQWGVFAIVAAFLLLALGARISLANERRGRQPVEETDYR